jgi:UDP-N-acetylmuramyl pentapeptide synthase
MLDALAAFMEVTPDATPRFYVLGGLKELGPEEEQWHQRVGEAVPFRPQDRAILVAENAAAYRQGLLNAGWNNSQITLLDDAREAQALLADQTGAFFLKGSRAYRLENALPETLLTTATH